MMISLESFLSAFYIVDIRKYNNVPMEQIPDFISEAVPILLLMMLFEHLYSSFWNIKLYSLKDTILSLGCGSLQQLYAMWQKETKMIPYIFIYGLSQQYGVGRWFEHVPLLGWLHDDTRMYLKFVLGMLGTDFGYYFAHRSFHTFHWMWASHKVHHSAERYNMAMVISLLNRII